MLIVQWHGSRIWVSPLRRAPNKFGILHAYHPVDPARASSFQLKSLVANGQVIRLACIFLCGISAEIPFFVIQPKLILAHAKVLML